jgi:hypothetical protein
MQEISRNGGGRGGRHLEQEKLDPNEIKSDDFVVVLER